VLANCFPMKKLFLIVVLFTLSSCETLQDQMNSWLGASKQQLLMSWGPSDRTTSDGNGGEILVYAKAVYLMATSYSPSMTYWDYKMMYVNSNDKIYYWMTRRERVPPQEINLNVYNRN